MNESTLILTIVVVSVLVTLTGVVTSFSLLSSYTPDLFPATGQASVGNVSIYISNELSITTIDDNSIAFTGCYPNRTIYSNETEGDGAGACPGFVPDSIIIRNDGDIRANVTINFSNWGEVQGGTFINSSDNSSWIAFKLSNTTTNALYGGGCIGFLRDSWTIVNGTEFVVCDALQERSADNSIEFDIAIHIPANVTGGTASTMISFFASESGA